MRLTRPLPLEFTVLPIRKPVRCVGSSQLQRRAVEGSVRLHPKSLQPIRPPGHTPACSPAYFHIIGREDAQSTMVLPFQPVLVHLLVDVDNVTLLQSQLPAGQSKDIQQSEALPILLPFRPCLVHPESHPPLGRPRQPCPPLLPQGAETVLGVRRREKGTYLGDCAWKSNLSLAAFLWAGGEDRGNHLSQAGGRSETAITGAHPRPPRTLTLVLSPLLTFFSSFLAGLPPRSEALGSVEKRYLSLGTPRLGGRSWDGVPLPHPHPMTGTSGSRGLYERPASPPPPPPTPSPGTSLTGAWWRASG